MSAAMLEPGLLQALQQHMLSYLSLEDLLQLAQASKDANHLVMTASLDLWQRAGLRHMPWHPPLAAGALAVRAAVKQYAACCTNVAKGQAETVASWDESHAPRTVDSPTRAPICISKGGGVVAWYRAALPIQDLHTGGSKNLCTDMSREVLSCCWHPNDEQISVLSCSLVVIQAMDIMLSAQGSGLKGAWQCMISPLDNARRTLTPSSPRSLNVSGHPVADCLLWWMSHLGSAIFLILSSRQRPTSCKHSMHHAPLLARGSSRPVRGHPAVPRLPSWVMISWVMISF